MHEIGCILATMRSAFRVIGIVLIAVSWTFAQAEGSECPTISMYGPAGIPVPGEPVKFGVELKGSVPSDVKYRWSVSRGKIVDGQDTTVITVIYERPASSVTATVEVLGLAEGCPNEVSKYAPYCEPAVAILVAEGSTLTTKIDKARLDKLASELAVNPGTQGYLIEYFPAKISQRTINAKLRLIRQYIKDLIEKERLTIVLYTAPEPFSKYYVVPPGATNPTP